MSLKKALEEKIQNTQLKMQELSIGMEKLEDDYQELLKELGLTSEELQDYAENPNNYSPPIWEQLQSEKKMLDEKLNLALTNIRDPIKAKEALSERAAIQNHWIYVR
ncbi:MAG: hypothetical protein H0V82_08795 [Candidatus Protochlamydia sp.]|nr:hypothetical protein [Candidatus Protochlamydia sp.]